MSTVETDSPSTRTSSPDDNPCELCGGRRFEIIARRDRRGRPLETAICLGCGLVAHAKIPSDEELAEYYARHYRSEYHAESSPSAKRVMRAWKNGRRILRQLGPFLRGDEKVFEVGAGIGCTVKVFERAGFDASGIEPGEGFQRFGREQLRARVDRGSLFEQTGEARYDLVLLIHVIEHFNSPSRALKTIHRLVRPHGRLYLECPNLAAPFAAPGRLFHVAHVYNFTPWTLLALAAKCGFELETWLSEPHDSNLEVLLRWVEQGREDLDPLGCSRTKERLACYSTLTYHLRTGYLANRLRKVASYLWEQWAARRFVGRLCAECARPGTS